MYKGGPIYKPFSAVFLHYATLFIPLLLGAYGVLTEFRIIKSLHSITTIEVTMLVVWCLYVCGIQFFTKSKTKRQIALRLITYHLLIASFIIFVSGTASPIIVFWLILMYLSYYYFKEKGIQLSIMAFAIVMAIDIIFWHGLGAVVIVSDLISLIVVFFIGIVALSIAHSQTVSRRELNLSKAQESLHRDRTLTIVNNLTDAVMSTDMDGIIRIYNAASLNLLDTNNSLNGKHIDDVVKLVDQDDKSISLFKEFKKAKRTIKRDDVNFVFSDGEEIRLEVTFSPIHSSFSRSKKAETHDGYIIIMRDITKAKSLEEERDEFISVVSHELRTPITIAEGTISNAQLMLNNPKSTPEMLKNAIDMAHEQTIFLANMVNDLSTLSRAERGVLSDTEKIDVRELAHKLFDKYDNEARKKNLHLDLDLSPNLGFVYTSRLYLEELLQNFITNSIKYTKEGSVKIIIHKKDNQVNFAIKDTGIGIGKTDQQKVFDKFYRSEDYRTRETGGTGLGLYVSAKLAKKIGAKIELKSRLNFGSTFSFSLPESTES